MKAQAKDHPIADALNRIATTFDNKKVYKGKKRTMKLEIKMLKKENASLRKKLDNREAILGSFH
jgi:hypothetical protein